MGAEAAAVLPLSLLSHVPVSVHRHSGSTQKVKHSGGADQKTHTGHTHCLPPDQSPLARSLALTGPVSLLPSVHHVATQQLPALPDSALDLFFYIISYLKCVNTCVRHSVCTNSRGHTLSPTLGFLCIIFFTYSLSLSLTQWPPPCYPLPQFIFHPPSPSPLREQRSPEYPPPWDFKSLRD